MEDETKFDMDSLMKMMMDQMQSSSVSDHPEDIETIENDIPGNMNMPDFQNIQTVISQNAPDFSFISEEKFRKIMYEKRDLLSLEILINLFESCSKTEEKQWINKFTDFTLDLMLDEDLVEYEDKIRSVSDFIFQIMNVITIFPGFIFLFTVICSFSLKECLNSLDDKDHPYEELTELSIQFNNGTISDKWLRYCTFISIMPNIFTIIAMDKIQKDMKMFNIESMFGGMAQQPEVSEIPSMNSPEITSSKYDFNISFEGEEDEELKLSICNDLYLYMTERGYYEDTSTSISQKDCLIM